MEKCFFPRVVTLVIASKVHQLIALPKTNTPVYRYAHTMPRGKATQQKLSHAISICGCYIGSAVACHLMLCGLKIRSANCWSHQRKPRGIWWVSGFKMVSASLRKKSYKVPRHSVCLITNRLRICRRIFKTLRQSVHSDKQWKLTDGLYSKDGSLGRSIN